MSDSSLAPSPRLKVLLVEDSLAMQDTLRAAVKTMGLELAGVAATAEGAMAAFASGQPDVVILDLVLQAGSGFEVLLRIKERAPTCRVMVFTRHDEESFRKRCLAAGADYFLSKNREHGELWRQLQNISDTMKSAHAREPNDEPLRVPAAPAAPQSVLTASTL
jgi:two-component system response regulator DevR